MVIEVFLLKRPFFHLLCYTLPAAPNDKELLSTMMHRLAKAEQSLMLAQETNREKVS